MKKMASEFKEFIARGNVMDLAVGVIIGGAFSAIVTSLVNDIIMPIISLITGGIDFTNWFISLDGTKYNTLSEAQSAGASVLAYGSFIQAIIYFLILAFVIFMLVKGVNRLTKIKKKEEEKKEEAPSKSAEEELLEKILTELKKKNK